ncbi:10780_t:CDS:2 [Acaulospora morrowiae]|uniref:10780_t:CDS:1 n=1 Tax=Acaulospora morrowiae TaxID=94023 RepID=A0A9N9EZX4_9GLOM|nr:10780_t:CDS:2 [Acaulospora morrowiae]
MATTYTSLNSTQMFNEKQDIINNRDDVEFSLENVNINLESNFVTKSDLNNILEKNNEPEVMESTAENINDDRCDYGDDDYNTIIKVGEEPDVKEFKAGSVILSSRSAYFRIALSHEWARKDGDKFYLEKPNVKPRVFDVILKYLYTEELKLDELDADDIYGLFSAADEFMLDDLLEKVPDDIGENMDFWQDQDCVPVMSTIFGMDSYQKLRKYLVNKINAYPQWLLEAEDLCCIEEHVLVGFLRQENMAFDHITRWNLIIQWALSQHPNLDNELLKSWSDDEFGMLGITIRNLIPLIQFSEISRNDFHSKILPYERILPQDTEDYTLKWYLTKYRARSSQGLKNSNLINHVHAAHFIKWIGGSARRDEKQPKIPCRCKFDLVYRLSRDGFSSYSEKCNQKGPTLAIAKVAGQRCLIGGYDPYGLHTNNKNIYKPEGISMKDNFIFFFDNRENKSEITRCRLSKFDVLYRNFLSEDGPCFGDLRLILKYNSGVFMPSFYTSNASNLSKMFFDIEECEIFKVTKMEGAEKPRSNPDIENFI